MQTTPNPMNIDLSHYRLSEDEVTEAELVAVHIGFLSEDAESAQRRLFGSIADAMELFCIEPVNGEIPASVLVGAGMILKECGHNVTLPAEVEEFSSNAEPLINPTISPWSTRNG